MSGWEMRALVGVRVYSPDTQRVLLLLGDARWSRWKLRSNLMRRLQDARNPVRAVVPASDHYVGGQREGASD